jgi:hypothetical protein
VYSVSSDRSAGAVVLHTRSGVICQDMQQFTVKFRDAALAMELPADATLSQLVAALELKVDASLAPETIKLLLPKGGAVTMVDKRTLVSAGTYVLRGWDGGGDFQGSGRCKALTSIVDIPHFPR